MSKPRRYQLLCPIARALDRIGDRWTLLILRDLHAGPARFSDLQSGLDGIASNLLAGRLQQLLEDGLARRRDAGFGATVYELTETGAKSADLLFELAMFGGQFPPDPEMRRPGNLRTVAVTLKAACQRVVKPETDLTAELIIDGEHFTLTARDGAVDVRSGAPDAPDAVFSAPYEPMIAAADGRLPMEQFMAEHMRIEAQIPGKDNELGALLGAAMTLIRSRG